MAQASKRNKKQPKATPSAEEIVQGFLTHFVRLTTINLVMHESKNPPTLPGGHTIFRHVNMTDAQLQNRLDTENIPAAGRFTDLDTAHAAITETIAANFQQVLRWATKTTSTSITLSHELSYDIGVVIERDKPGKIQKARRIVVSFSKDRTGAYPLENSIITSHPSLEER
ncbi:TPA: hypothetical protein PJH94_004342 [Raoultella planticola]|nr:hypothetical protein [Raoultella planticola]